jgi:hypothetical protein
MQTKSFIFIAAALLAAPVFAQSFPSTPDDDHGPAGLWMGFVQRGGNRSPATVELSDDHDKWAGSFVVGGVATPVDNVRVSGNVVHFDLPGEGSFDGKIDGDTFAGSVSGRRKGSFELTRRETDNPIEDEGP